VTQPAPVLATTTATEPWWAPVWASHGARYETATSVAPVGEAALRKELIFCLLGGHGVTYELAQSATKVVHALSPFHPSWTEDQLRHAIQRELGKPQFEPRRADGSLRRYRFPARKARLITDAVLWVLAEGGLRGGLAARGTEAERRSWLCKCPGVGMKTASWLLRNCGWAQRVAIIDVHLLRALTEAGVIAEPRLPRDYEKVENAYLRWAEQLGACPAALDLFLWDVQRSR
jgi:thermostable 8-oxoguanine DNA glycosylase